MDEEPSKVEMGFHGMAAIGLVVTLLSGMIFRRSFDWESLLSAWAGVALLVGGVVGARRHKQKRLARLMDSAQTKAGVDDH